MITKDPCHCVYIPAVLEGLSIANGALVQEVHQVQQVVVSMDQEYWGLAHRSQHVCTLLDDVIEVYMRGHYLFIYFFQKTFSVVWMYLFTVSFHFVNG